MHKKNKAQFLYFCALQGKISTTLSLKFVEPFSHVG